MNQCRLNLVNFPSLSRIHFTFMSCTWRRTGSESRTHTNAISGPKNNVDYVLEVNIFRRVNIFSFIARSRALRTNLRLLPRWISVPLFFFSFSHCIHCFSHLGESIRAAVRYAETIRIYARSVLLIFFTSKYFISSQSARSNHVSREPKLNKVSARLMKMEVQNYYYRAIDMWKY